MMAIVAPLLAVLRTMRAQLEALTRRILAITREDATCCRLMSVPGVGPITALAFRATVDDPNRFAKSRAVGAHLGLTPARYQSGETDIQGRISRCGDETPAPRFTKPPTRCSCAARNGRACAPGG